MTDPIIQLKADDFDEAMDFLNLVFSVHGPHDFAAMLPILYQPTDTHMAHHYAIKKNGRIRGIVGMYPITWQVGEAVLRVAGIGAVSTHADYAGTGLMSALMQHCVRLMQEQGFHLSYLGGQRQRYLYFGYERCGHTTSFTVNKSNLKHCFDDRPSIRFEALGPQDAERIARAKTLHDARPVHCHRPLEDFYHYCVSWFNRPFAVLDESGRMVGYLIASKNADQVTELGAENDEVALRMVRAWIDEHCKHAATIAAHPLRGSLAYQLGRVCEQAGIQASGNWQIFDWVAVIDALLQVQRLSLPLVKGRVVVGIKGYGAVELQVEGEKSHCVATTARPDVECSTPTALRLLCGPLPPSCVMPLPPRAAPLESWCPLPLIWARQDSV